MNHSFDIENAQKYGVIEAILLENFLHWLRVNKANEKNIHDGKVWTYNSVQAYSKLFPYLTPKQIRRAIDSLVESKALIKGEYNKANYDKTSWYSIPDESILAIGPKGQMDLPSKASRSARKGKPIPDINTNPNPDINNAKPKASPSLYKQVVDLIGRAHKHLTGSDLSWKGREGRYGKSVKLILENVSGMAPELAFEQVRQKCAAYVLAAQSDKYMKTQGVTPVSIFDFWNKVHFKAGKTVVGDFGKENRKPFPDYKSMSPEQIEAAFHNWKKSWNEFDLKENISPESYQKFREAGGFNHALPGILIEEVHGKKKRLRKLKC